MQDRATAVFTRGISCDATGLLHIPGNRHRTAIVISVPVGTSAFIQPGGGDGLATGILLNANIPYIELTADRYGTAIQENINVQATVAAAVVFGIVEFVSAP